MVLDHHHQASCLHVPAQAPPALRIEVAPGIGRITVWLAGEIDLATRAELESVLRFALGEPRELVLDLRGVTFVDSSGINLFVALHRECERNGVRLAIAAPTEPTRRLFEVTGVDRLLTIDGTRPLEARSAS
jgi:anti-anti-sigma factor